MFSRLTGRSRARALLFAFILLLGLVPVSVATADSHRTATYTPISFTSTTVEEIDPGEEWVDEAGIFHLRGNVFIDEVSGDITGTAVIDSDADFEPSPNCDPDDEFCEDGYFSLWGSVVLTDENGTWDGEFIIATASEGGEEFSFGKIVLTGRGGNAGKSIIADITTSDDPEEETAYFEGYMLTMALPVFGVNMHTQLCFGEEELGYGAFVSNGAIESSGGASGSFFTAGSIWTHTYALYGLLEFTDDQGSLTIEFMGMSQDTAETNVGWGHWLITDGTGTYENVLGHGKITGFAGPMEQCESGFGVWLQFLGDVHFN